MAHEIVIKIESEKEWAAVCALSSLLEKPVSEIAKDDFIDNLRSIAENIKKDKKLSDLIAGRNPENLKRILAILK